MSVANVIRSCLTLISPKINAKVVHRIKTGRNLDFQNPKTLAEKLVVLKIQNYNRNPLVKKCADKYAVRDYVKAKGYGDLLNDFLAVYDTVDDIQWEKLPNQFAMKWNFGCGFNIICTDKTQLDIPKTTIQLRNWRRVRPYLGYAEMQYKGVEKKILVEKYLSTSDGHLPPDYKLYCFNGKCVAILYIADRNLIPHRGAFFDTNWHYLGLPMKEGRSAQYAEFDALPQVPNSLNKMIEAAQALSEPFPFVRVDFYDIDGKAVFGEMTFTPAGGHDVSEIDIDGKPMGDLLSI